MTSMEDGEITSLDAPHDDADRDGARWLHDTDAEAGDEQEVADLFLLDRQEAREVGAQLDDVAEDEPALD